MSAMTKRQLLAIGGALVATAFAPNSFASTLLAGISSGIVQAQRLYTIDEALRVPAIAALFDESKHAILQLDYADFAAVTQPLHADARSQMWVLRTAVSDPKEVAHRLLAALDAIRAPDHELLNALTVISCPTSSAVPFIQQSRALLTDVIRPTDMRGLAVVADESASAPSMTVLCVTKPNT